MNFMKLIYGLGHGSFAAAAGYGFGYAFHAQGLTPTTQAVILGLSAVLAGAAGLKLAGLLPDAGAEVSSQKSAVSGEMKLSLDIVERHPGVDESIRNDPEVRKNMESYRLAHPGCEVCGSVENCQVHHKRPLWMFRDEPRDVQLQHARDPKNYATLCENEKSNHHLWDGHDGCFAERCVPNVSEVIASRQIARRTA